MAPSTSCILLSAVLVVLLCQSPSFALGQDPPTPNVTHAEGHCIWYHECGPSSKGKYNCFYNGPAKNVTPGSDFQKSLREICPQYADGPVCCDQNQLDTLSGQIGAPKQLFSRCPACIKNFLIHFCATTCDPDSAKYVEPVLEYDTEFKQFHVKSATIYLADDYGQDLFDSCAKVQNPSDNAGKVVDLMCGGATPCTRDAWFKYLGTGNPYVPFEMYYKFGNMSRLGGIVPKDTFFYPCNYHNGSDYSLQCSCTDCGTPDICPSPPTPPEDTFPLKLITISVASVGGVLVLFLFVVALIAGIVQLIISRNRGYSQIGSNGAVGHAKYGTMDDDESDSPTSSVGSINDDELNLNTENDEACCCVGYFKIGAYFERWIKRVFYLWGKFATQYWYIVIVGMLILVACLSSGMWRFTLVTDPVHLWSSPVSRARTEKNYFDENFNPFYRTEMIIIKPHNQTKEAYFTKDPALGTSSLWTFGPALQWDVINETFFLQDYLTHMEVPFTYPNGTKTNITLEDICFKPLAPDNNNCTIMSVMNYFQNDYSKLSLHNPFNPDKYDYPFHAYYCARDPTAPEDTQLHIIDPTSFPKDKPALPCLGEFGGPVDPNLIFGGFNYNASTGLYNFQNATTLIITFTVNNHLDEESNAMAEAWEKAYLDHLKSYSGIYFNVSFLAERSTVDELERESQTDELTVLISYLFMFAYITLFLGHIRSVATVLIDMKFFVGFIGVLLVLLAVLAAIGLLSYIGVAASLIILEVVPFLVLAVGVDNLFIIVHSYERQTKKFAKIFDDDLSKVPLKELIGRALGEVAPSLLLTSLSETSAFLLGGISTMPAVRAFSFYAGTAVFFNFILQVTVFVAIVALDARRQLANRFDILFCLKLKGKFNPRAGVDIMHFVMKWFAKFLLYPVVRPFVLLVFGATTTLSLVFLFRVDIGLDQTLAFPKDSYLINYFNDLNTYLHSGSPVYFVIKEGVDYNQPDTQNKICSQAGCEKESLGTQIDVYSQRSNLTRIAEPGMLWLDTYFQWISPASNCCGVINNTDIPCRPPGKGNCTVCLKKHTPDNRPYPADFQKFIRPFLEANPDTNCPAAGHAAFGGGVKLFDNNTVKTSYVMTYHTVLKSSKEFINAIYWARKLSDSISNSLNITVFPYSVFYVFYEQYLTTVHDMAVNLGVSIGAVFLVTFLTMGLNLWAALIIMLAVVMIIVHMLGCMALAGISANAISLVNLVMTVGIAVEFCSHIVRWYCSCPLPTRYLRARSALANMGASVVSGITVTKFLGVFVLLFAKSQLFEIYYFRMYMFMLLWGALVGLVFLPVLLSYVGPPYCPVKNVPSPYDDSYLPTPQPDHTTTTTYKPQNTTNKSSNGSGVPPPRSNVPTSNQYPTLPNADEYEVGGSDQQNYPPTTYTGQNEYQRRGVPYGTGADENTKLINH